MLIYWVVFFILFLFSYVELISARQSLVLLRCVILFIACMVGFRYNIGADWETYVIIYNRQIPSLLDPEYRILMEPLFWILGSLCKTLGLSYACFFIILSLILSENRYHYITLCWICQQEVFREQHKTIRVRQHPRGYCQRRLSA